MPAWMQQWFDGFIRDVLAKLDTRNAIPGLGISIDGTPDQPATISANEDLGELFDADFAMAEATPLLPNARVLAGEAGVVSVTDEGPGGALRVGLAGHGIQPEKLTQFPRHAVLANAADEVAAAGFVRALLTDTVLRRVGDALEFGGLTVGMAADALWTYAKLQDVSADSVALGRKTTGAGPVEEVTLSELLDFVGGATAGDMLVRGASSWERLAAGTEGQVLKIVSGVPAWADPEFAPADAEFLTASDETTDLPNSRHLVDGSGVTFDDTTPGVRTVTVP